MAGNCGRALVKKKKRKAGEWDEILDGESVWATRGIFWMGGLSNLCGESRALETEDRKATDIQESIRFNRSIVQPLSSPSSLSDTLVR
jgi:hypothetical protein